MLKSGDIVAIRGDLRLRNDGSCQYTENQLFEGRYIKHAYHGGIWLGEIKSISNDMGLVGGMWRHISFYEKMA
ncbi:MAG: hypothetical protein KOO69_05850 [Victivallales bacterium]|nr:hypothetical protein [Victivallales bacterium]